MRRPVTPLAGQIDMFCALAVPMPVESQQSENVAPVETPAPVAPWILTDEVRAKIAAAQEQARAEFAAGERCRLAREAEAARLWFLVPREDATTRQQGPPVARWPWAGDPDAAGDPLYCAQRITRAEYDLAQYQAGRDWAAEKAAELDSASFAEEVVCYGELIEELEELLEALRSIWQACHAGTKAGDDAIYGFGTPAYSAGVPLAA